MSNLLKTKNEAALILNTTAANIMAFCRVITPQFYKGLSHSAMAAEKLAIELLTAHMDPPVLRKMCEMAAQNYGTARSENGKTFFDINYIMTFYRAAFNLIWCDSVEIPNDYYWSSDTTYDETTRIITERWYTENGGPDIIVKFITERKYDDRYDRGRSYERHYTPKYWKEQEKRRKEIDIDDI